MEVQKLPKPIYDDFHDYHRKITDSFRSDKHYPCPRCRGNGKIYDPNERDPYEGYKLASCITCPDCKNGELSKQYYFDKYNEYVKGFDYQYKVCYNTRELQKNAVSKAIFFLTEEERITFGITKEIIKELLYGIPY